MRASGSAAAFMLPPMPATSMTMSSVANADHTRCLRMCSRLRLTHNAADSSVRFVRYPFAYCVAVLPLSIVRWIDFVQEAKGRPNGISYQATFGAASVYELSGLFDVLLFLYARPGLLLHSERHPAAASGNRGYAPSLATVDTEKDNGAGEVCIHEAN